MGRTSCTEQLPCDQHSHADLVFSQVLFYFFNQTGILFVLIIKLIQATSFKKNHTL